MAFLQLTQEMRLSLMVLLFKKKKKKEKDPSRKGSLGQPDFGEEEEKNKVKRPDSDAVLWRN